LVSSHYTTRRNNSENHEFFFTAVKTSHIHLLVMHILPFVSHLPAVRCIGPTVRTFFVYP